MPYAFAHDRRDEPRAFFTIIRLIALGVATTLIAGMVRLALAHYLSIQ